MLDVKEATEGALSYFKDLDDENTFSNVLLEEVERDGEDGTSYWFWFITVGFTETKQEGGPLGPLGSDRRYKRFKINAETGEVVSMKIRSVENA